VAESVGTIRLIGGHGSVPQIHHVTSSRAAIETAAQVLRGWVDEGMPLSEIAVLHAVIHDVDGQNLPALMVQELEKQGLLASVISRDVHTKTAYDITSRRIAVSTVHSSKGLDWLGVVLLGLDLLDPNRLGIKLVSLVQVALTRPRERLSIVIAGDNTKVMDSLLSLL